MAKMNTIGGILCGTGGIVFLASIVFIVVGLSMPGTYYDIANEDDLVQYGTHYTLTAEVPALESEVKIVLNSRTGYEQGFVLVVKDEGGSTLLDTTSRTPYSRVIKIGTTTEISVNVQFTDGAVNKSDVELRVMVEEVSNAQSGVCCIGAVFLPLTFVLVLTGIILMIVSHQNKPRPPGSPPPVYHGTQWERGSDPRSLGEDRTPPATSAEKDHYGLDQKTFDDMKIVDDQGPSWVSETGTGQDIIADGGWSAEEARPKEVPPPPPI